MIRIDAKTLPAVARTSHRAPVRTLRPEDRAGREALDPAAGTPVFTAAGRYTVARLDRVDAGIPVRLGDPAVRRDRRREDARARPAQHGAPHGAATSATSASTTTASTTSPPTATCCALCARAASRPTSGRCRFYELALKVSGAVQAARWTELPDGAGLHPLVQRPALAVRRHHPLAALAGARPPARPCADGRARPQDLAARSASSQHADTTARYNVYYGEGRDAYDVRGRVAHESVFNLNDGSYRCPIQPAGLLAVHHLDARARLGAAGLRRAARVPRHARRTPSWRPSAAGRRCWRAIVAAARATADFYIEYTPT